MLGILIVQAQLEKWFGTFFWEPVGNYKILGILLGTVGYIYID